MTIQAENIIEGSETVIYTGKREVRFATWGKLGGEWLHFGWSSATDPAKAAGAARSTNPYATEYGATSVIEEGTATVRFTKTNGQIGNKPRKMFR